MVIIRGHQKGGRVEGTRRVAAEEEWQGRGHQKGAASEEWQGRGHQNGGSIRRMARWRTPEWWKHQNDGSGRGKAA